MSVDKEGNSFAVPIALGRILSMIMGFCMPIFLTRFLSKNDYGLYTQFYSIITFIYGIISFGIQSNLYYFYPTSNIFDKQKVVVNTLMLLIAFSFLSIAIFYIPFLAKAIMGNEDLYEYYYLIMLCVFFMIPNNIISPLYTVRKETKYAIILPPVETVSRVVMVIAAAIIFQNIKAIFISMIVYQIAVFIFVVFYSLKDVSGSFFDSVDLGLMKSQIRYALPFGMAVLFQTLLSKFDKIVSISFLTTEEYAIYSVAFYGIPGIMLIYSSLSQVNVINMTKEYQKKNINEVIALYKAFVNKTLSFSIPIILIVFLFSKEIICFLFTDDYVQAVPLFRAYILYFIVAMIGSGTVLRASGKTMYSMHAYFVSCIICLPIIYFLVKEFKMSGAMSGAMLGLILPKFIQMYFELKILNVTLRKYLDWNVILLVSIISFTVLLPYCLFYYYYQIGFGLCVLLALSYLGISYMIELHFNVFVVDKAHLKKIMTSKFVKCK